METINFDISLYYTVVANIKSTLDSIPKLIHVYKVGCKNIIGARYYCLWQYTFFYFDILTKITKKSKNPFFRFDATNINLLKCSYYIINIYNYCKSLLL